MKAQFKNSSSKKLRVAYISLFAAIFIVTLKFFATLLSGSVGVLSELFHSSTDLIATMATIISVRYSAKPPDKDHHYGHEKIESFSALFQVFILLIMCAYLIYESIHRLIYQPTVNISWFTFSVILICIFIDISRSRALMKVARETKSQALEADSLHFSSDVLSSIVVLIGMIFTYFDIYPIADPISAIIVSFIIIITTLSLTKRAFDSLLDKVPKELKEKLLKDITDIKGIEGIRSLRIRTTGSKYFIDMTILISRTRMFNETHEITIKAEKTIKNILPDADIIIHTEPIETKDETINDKIRMIIANEGYKCHDIFSHRIKNQIFTELHVEINYTKDLLKAHNDISELESIIKKEIPIINEIKIHLDEPSEILYNTIDITVKSRDIISKVSDIIKSEINILDMKDFKVLKSGNKIRVSLTCIFDKNVPFDQVHDIVTHLESKIYLHLKDFYQNLTNVIIHAEPN